MKKKQRDLLKEFIKESFLHLIGENEPREMDFVGKRDKYGKLLAVGRKIGIQEYKSNLLKGINKKV